MIVGVVLALALFGGGVAYATGDLVFAFRGASVDVVLASPCDVRGGTRGASGPHVYDGNAWITYTCENGEVVTRRYLNPNDNAGVEPIPVFTVVDPNASHPKTQAITTCAVPGMVTGIYGGCVPMDHPNAPTKNWGNNQ
jgi:hypothetical protein